MNGATGNDKEDDTRRNENQSDKEKNESLQPKENLFLFCTKQLKAGESFFALDPVKGVNRKPPDPVTEKVLPLSQPSTKELFECHICCRKFTSKGGRTKHLKACSKKKSLNTEVNAVTNPTVESTSQFTSSSTSSAPAVQPIRVWGQHTQNDLRQIISAAYEEIVHWQKNLFMVPTGASGKKFVKETTKFIEYFNSNSEFFCEISMKVLMIMPSLLLQKPGYKSKSKIHVECLSRRLVRWEEGDFDALLQEGRAIQKKNSQNNLRKKNPETLAKRFTNFMLKGQTTAAMRLLDSAETSGVLSLDDEVISQLREKHPDAVQPDPEALINGEVPFVDPVMFHDLDEAVIARAAARTKGAAGPSGMDAESWKRIILSKSFGKESDQLQTSLAKLARTLCVQHRAEIHDDSNKQLEAYTSCRLIPLDKNPGVRPIGIGETIRRIIGKAILQIVRNDVIESAGSLQLCAGQPGGAEAAVHAANKIFEDADTDAVLLVDATNAFNSLNRKTMLHNIKFIYPPLAIYIRNCYLNPSRLFISGGGEIKSSEGTTQGDPHAMPVYAVGITPLLPVHANVSLNKNTKQIAFADDLLGAGKLISLREYWNRLFADGPRLGYYPNASKTWLVVKPEVYELAKEIFADTTINVTCEGRKYLGGFIGTNQARDVYTNDLVSNWSLQLENLCKIAKSEPQAAFNGFCKGFRHKLTYHMRVLPNLHEQLKTLDEILNNSFIPAITGGHICSQNERELLSLPFNTGGMAIPILKELATSQYNDSKTICQQLVESIIKQDRDYFIDKSLDVKRKKDVVTRNQARQKQKLEEARQLMSLDEERANDVAQLKGASSWLSAAPSIHDNNFSLNKREFNDAVSIRYRWQPKYLPQICECGKSFSVDHALCCMKGGFIHTRHDDLRNTFANLLSEICNDVAIEPSMLALNDELETGKNKMKHDLTFRPGDSGSVGREHFLM